MGTLMNFLEHSTIFSSIKHVFPIRGHSYMPADRVFGLIEKEYTKLEEMVSPKDYYDVLEKTGNLSRYGQDWTVKNIKDETKKIFKTKLPFKISETKIIKYQRKKEKVEIFVSTTYSGGLIKCAVLKNNIKNALLVDNAKVLPKCNMVNIKKRDNVKLLLQCVDIPDHAKEFYQDVMAAANDNTGKDEDNINKDYDDSENAF
ncbi:unnamed protein product [Psylliodes chrysocephalus]|uniref:Uncharacterized protein n=1 Tax=Psylliodes chrysocephalus TaxID=3402493 RepID=A0A9P0CJJ2_9CUCU|nr:unnamed protein product [Psylliodes chrysocephala]